MSEEHNPERDLIRGALLPAVVVGVIGIVVAAIARGRAGFFAAVLAQLVVVMYFTVHLVVSSISRKLDPLTTFALAIFSYFAKIALLGIGLWLITKFTSRETIDRASFGIVALALTIAWLGGEIRSFLKLQLHLPLPSEALPSKEPGSDT